MSYQFDDYGFVFTIHVGFVGLLLKKIYPHTAKTKIDS